MYNHFLWQWANLKSLECWSCDVGKLSVVTHVDIGSLGSIFFPTWDGQLQLQPKIFAATSEVVTLLHLVQTNDWPFGWWGLESEQVMDGYGEMLMRYILMRRAAVVARIWPSIFLWSLSCSWNAGRQTSQNAGFHGMNDAFNLLPFCNQHFSWINHKWLMLFDNK